MSKSRPLAQPFQYSITDPRFDAVKVSTGLAFKSTIALTLLYSGGVALYLSLSMMAPLPSTVNIHNLAEVLAHILMTHQIAFVMGVLSFLTGIIPAQILVTLSGWLIGKFFQRWVPAPLTSRQAQWLGFRVSAGMLGVRLLLGYLLTRIPPQDATLWLIWYGPNLLAFVGLWWLVYRVNEQMIFPVGAAPLNDN